jgi:hypothetical protein
MPFGRHNWTLRRGLGDCSQSAVLRYFVVASGVAQGAADSYHKKILMPVNGTEHFPILACDMDRTIEISRDLV